ncbi:MAG: SH3 domain-containing protein [Bacteroidaceae bacterium]|nr:SH3 domain-containing protein [Bacteroidaceae bacterium]
MSTRDKFVRFAVVTLLALLAFWPLRSAGQDTVRVVTIANVNLRSSPHYESKVLKVVPLGDTLTVVTTSYQDWCAVGYKGQTAYISAHYLKKVKTDTTSETATPHSRSFLEWVLYCIWIVIIVGISLYVLRLVFWILVGSVAVLAAIFTNIFNIVSFPVVLLNALQRFLSKPWLPLLKPNRFSDNTNRSLRTFSILCQIPFYILCFPLRLLNAGIYNLLIHIPFELYNYLIEVFLPSHPNEGAGHLGRWFLYLPWRILKYMLWHTLLTITESLLWTVIDTFVPALTLFHGTSEKAAQAIVQSPDRQTGYRLRDIGIWRVGGGNYAGDGIYFAPARSTAEHYAGDGSLIVCRVSPGKILELGIAPKRVFNACGKPNAHIVTKWGLENRYTTGEWWRGDTGWWEYCMYDWQNRYNFSWRIRPLYVIHLDTRHIQRIPGGMSHWLFREMVIKDIIATFSALFHHKSAAS